MIKETGPRRPSRAVAGGPRQAADDFVYRVELWDMGRSTLEQMLGRADSVAVATAIYEAAVRDHPFRLVVLRRRGTVVRSTE